MKGWKGRGRAGVEGSGFFISRGPVAARRLFLRTDASHEKIASLCLQLPSPLNPLTHSPFRCSIAPHLQSIYPSFNPHCPNFPVHSADIHFLLHTLTNPSSTYSRLCSRPTLSTSLAHRFTKEQVSRLQTPPPPPPPAPPLTSPLTYQLPHPDAELDAGQPPRPVHVQQLRRTKRHTPTGTRAPK